jgi:N-acetylmuramoyl-L-alanine amidase
MSKIFIGVGHGGADSGAAANGLKEKDLNLAVALACRDVLERHGVTVLLSRTKDEGDDVNEEIRECNAFKPDFAIDIHINAGGGDGAEVFHSINNGAGKNLAENVNKEIIEIGQNSRGVKTKTNSSGGDYYAFIRNTNAPAIIAECAFIDNIADIAIIDTATEQQEMGVAIAKGILATLGITYKGKAVTGATDNVPDAYAGDAIIWAVKNGILYGDSNGDYKLHKNISRQDMLVFLYRALSK